MANGVPPITQAISGMLNALRDAAELTGLPVPPPPLPPATVSMVRVSEQIVGLGSRLGNETRGTFPVVALRGVRLDAVVRFQLWANALGIVETAIDELHGKLLSAKPFLQANGFLRLIVDDTPMAEYISPLDAWRKTTNYRVLYEFPYEEADGAESLIARILINLNGEHGESTVVTDEITRWDDQDAPALEVRRSTDLLLHIHTLVILAFLPDGWNGEGVIISTVINGIPREQTFDSVRSFLQAFTLESEAVELGGNAYRAGHLVFPNAAFPEPIILRGNDDRFRVSYAAPRFENGAIAPVVYLRVQR
jgi:hypothetical protein